MKPYECLPGPGSSLSGSGVDPRAFRCCLCCHVKTGTFLYGLLVVLGDVLLLGFVTFATIHPDVLTPQVHKTYDGVILVQSSNDSFFQTFGYELAKGHLERDHLLLMFGITLVCMISGLALIYGIVKNIASYLMPFFYMQVFDFCLSCLVAVGCFTYAPNVKHWIHDQGLENYPGMNYLLSMDANYLLLLFVGVVSLVLAVKAYLLCMVWSCYKYIQLHAAARTAARQYNMYPGSEDSEVLHPPCYEEAIKVPAVFQPPPAYHSG